MFNDVVCMYGLLAFGDGRAFFFFSHYTLSLCFKTQTSWVFVFMGHAGDLQNVFHIHFVFDGSVIEIPCSCLNFLVTPNSSFIGL